MSWRAVVMLVLLPVAACERGPITPSADRAAPAAPTSRALLDEVRHAPLAPELRHRLAESPHNLFRFVNRTWTQTACDAFRDEITAVPAVRLHGDAHIEQYAVTEDARGLDDFDDSATGPALVDLVRFLGSLKLAAFQRGWSEADGTLADAFFDGYRRALANPAYLPSDPVIVRRARERTAPGPAAFLAQADSLMLPLSPDDRAQFDEQWPRVEAYAREVNGATTADQLYVKAVGWLHLGIGSALARKLLVRIEGPSQVDEDDLILEGKEVLTLSGVSCLTVPRGAEAFRVVEGLEQVGRLHNDILVVVPLMRVEQPNMRGWWVKNWQPSYQELEIADFASASELIEIAHDVGAQLGSTNLGDGRGSLAAQKRLLELEAVRRLEPRVRQVADDLERATLEAWEALRLP